MEVGDFVYCTETHGLDLFTKGKYYEVVDIQIKEDNHDVYVIINNRGTIHRFIGVVDLFFVSKKELNVPMKQLRKHYM